MLYLLFIIVNGVSDPVVCKVENYKVKIREKAKVEKENISSGAVSKPKPTKEVFIRVSCSVVQLFSCSVVQLFSCLFDVLMLSNVSYTVTLLCFALLYL